MSGALWTVEAMAAAMDARHQGALPASVTGLSIDTRTIQAGEAFFALADVRDGHDFVPAAVKAGAGVAVVAADKAGAMPKDAPLLIVPDVLEGLRALAPRGAHTQQGEVHRRHRLGRQDQLEGGAAACAVALRRNPCVGGVLQQPLGRAAVAGALSGERALRGA